MKRRYQHFRDGYGALIPRGKDSFTLPESSLPSIATSTVAYFTLYPRFEGDSHRLQHREKERAAQHAVQEHLDSLVHQVPWLQFCLVSSGRRT